MRNFQLLYNISFEVVQLATGREERNGLFFDQNWRSCGTMFERGFGNQLPTSRQGSSSSVTCFVCACVWRALPPPRRVGSTDRYQCEPLTADIPTAILTWVLRSLPGWVDSLKPQACSLANWPQWLLYPLYQLLASTLLCFFYSNL